MDSSSTPQTQTRSILFIDGSNWYHGLKRIGIDSDGLNYPRIARKLLVDRQPCADQQLCGIRYYVGKAPGPRHKIAEQEKFLNRLQRQGVEFFLGQVAKNWMEPKRNPMTAELRDILAKAKSPIPADTLASLSRLCDKAVPYNVEKQVDVRIAVDLVSMAHRDEYDAAYLLSADGDFVPAVEEAQRLGKTVFAASAAKKRWQLGDAVDAFIPLNRQWFDGASFD